jgi:hypothetical protein
MKPKCQDEKLFCFPLLHAVSAVCQSKMNTELLSCSMKGRAKIKRNTQEEMVVF